MATKKQAQATKVRVLVAGAFGQPDDVIELDGEALAPAWTPTLLRSSTPRA